MGKQRNTMSKLSKYLPILIILLSITIVVGSTFAYFTDTDKEDGLLTFSKVELSDETNVGISGTIRDAIPGTKLIDGAIEFSKSIDSAPLYVRAKISFSATSENEDMSLYVDALRNSEKLGIITTEQNGAYWSEKEGNYFYLLNSDKSSLKVVDDTYVYTLSENMVVPYDLEQLPNLSQYMENVNFHIAFQAIQAENITNNLTEVKSLFNEIFPESDNEKIKVVEIKFMDKNLSDTYLTSIITNGVTTRPADPVYDGDTVFVGWYSDAAFTTPFEFGKPITESITLYPKTVQVSPLSDFIFDGDKVVDYVGSSSEVVIPVSYSIGASQTETVTVEDFNDFYSKYSSNSLPAYPFTAYDSNSNPITITSWVFDSWEHMNYSYPVTYTTETVEYVKGDDFTIKTIDNSLFRYDSNLTSIVMLNGLENIGAMAFQGCTNLTSVVLPDSLKVIGEYAFSDCTGLDEIEIKNGLQEIKAYAFNSCTNISNISLPATISFIGVRAFDKDLQNVIIDDNNQSYCVVGNAIYTKDKTSLVLGFNNTDFTQMPAEIEIIGDWAFSNCESITSINLLDRIKHIGNSAFSGTTISEVTGYSSLEFVGDYAFNNVPWNNNLSGMVYLGKVLYKFVGTFNGVLDNINEDVVQICGSAFNNQSGLTGVVLPAGLKYIGSYAFQNTGITAIELPQTIVSIGTYAFYQTGLTSLQLPSALESIGAFAFGNTDIDKVVIPVSVETVGERIFGTYDVASVSNSDITIYVESETIPTTWGDKWNYLGCDAMGWATNPSTPYIGLNVAWEYVESEPTPKA